MLGHCHPGVTAAIQEQAETLTLCPSYLYNDKRAEFAKALVGVLPKHLPHVFLANSGAEAMDGALKFARLFTKRSAFVAATKGFHGRTMGALSVTWEPKYREGFRPAVRDRARAVQRCGGARQGGHRSDRRRRPRGRAGRKRRQRRHAGFPEDRAEGRAAIAARC